MNVGTLEPFEINSLIVFPLYKDGSGNAILVLPETYLLIEHVFVRVTVPLVGKSLKLSLLQESILTCFVNQFNV
mgnify:CR=1 FL=1